MSAKLFRVREDRMAASHIREYANATSTTQEEVLEVAVKQYTPINQPEPLPRDAVTIFACHGASLPKETYEPLWDELLRCSKSCGSSIRNIWITDMANMGYSSVLNEHKLSYDYSWMDHARDLLLVVNEFRAEMPRPIVGIGHSVGGTSIVNLALLHPRLFTTTILMDPFLAPIEKDYGFKYPGLTNVVAYMPDVFPNRAAAARFVHKNPAYKVWDPRAQTLMVEHGFCNLPTALHPSLPPNSDPLNPPVTYTSTKHQWVWSQCRENFDAAEPGHKIKRSTHADLDPSIAKQLVYRPELWTVQRHVAEVRPPALFLLAGKTYIDLELLRKKIKEFGTGVGGSGGMAEGRVKEVTLDGQNHTFPQEIPAVTAGHCASWLGTELARFREEQTESDRRQRLRNPRDHLELNSQWLDVIKPVSAFTERPSAAFGRKPGQAKL